MIPLLPTLSSQPSGNGSAAGTTRAALTPPARQDPGDTTAGRFAELFDALLPAAAGLGVGATRPGPASDATTGPSTGSDATPNLGREGTDTHAGQDLPVVAPHGAEMLNRGAQQDSLPEPAPQQPGITARAEATASQESSVSAGPTARQSSGEKRAVAPDLGAGGRHSFPIAKAPMLLLQLPVNVVPPQGPPFPVADVPMLQMPLTGAEVPTEGPQLPMAKAPLLVMPVPGETAPTAVAQPPAGEAPRLDAAVPNTHLVGPAAGVSGQSAAQQLAVSAAGDPEPAAEPLLSPANEAGRATGQPLPAGTGLIQVPVPAATLTGQQSAHVGAQEAATSDAATIPVDAEPAPGALANTPATSALESAGPPEPHPIPLPVAMMGDHAATAGALGRTSNDFAVTSVGAADPVAESQPARTTVPQPLHRQMLGPIATLAAGPNGERTLSVNIAPEALGPITVKAHLGADGIRMELSAPTDAGREALRAMLPELRRELAAAGHSGITVGTGQDSAATSGGYRGEQHGGGGQRSYAGTDSRAAGIRTEFEVESQLPPIIPAQQIPSHLDVMA